MKEEISIILRDLANELGVTVDFLWGVLLKQAPISLIGEMLSLIIFSSIAFILLIVGAKSIIKEDDDDFEIAIPTFVIGLTLSIIALISILINIPQAITIIFNPEYWALEQILDRI